MLVFLSTLHRPSFFRDKNELDLHGVIASEVDWCGAELEPGIRSADGAGNLRGETRGVTGCGDLLGALEANDTSLSTELLRIVDWGGEAE